MREPKEWPPEEDLISKQNLPLEQIAKQLNRSVDSVRQHRHILKVRAGMVKDSSFPRYDKPLEFECDKIVIFPDIESPFHNAEFINRVIDLSLALKIDTMLAAGDLFHLECLSGWEPSWKGIITSYMDEETKDDLIDLLNSLPRDKRTRGFEILEKTEPKADNTFAEEIREAKKLVQSLNIFTNRSMIMGNHEGRLLRTMNNNLEGQNLSDIFGMKDWQTSEYYFAVVTCGKEVWRIAHPKPYAKNAPADMASRFLCHYAMGHSHDWSQRFDRSGKFYAISMGHCADETKFPYEAQRDRMYWEHVPGALILLGGKPYLLNQYSDWERLKKM